MSVYMKQAKEESAHQQNSNLVDALKNASNKTCLSQTNIEKSGWGGGGWNLGGGGFFWNANAASFICY